MNKILISVFETQTSAFEGLTALKDLHRNGDITLYASTVITKDAQGWVSVPESHDRGPVGTLVGLTAGGLLGLLGGPVGVAVGASVGGLGGLVFDMAGAGISNDFVVEVTNALTPGRTAVVADIDETWVTPVDTRLGALGATIFRRYPGDVMDEELVREAQQASADLDHLRDELRQSTGAARASVEAAIARQRDKLQAIAARVDSALQQQRSAFEARLATLRAQRQQASEQQRKRIDARIDELKADHEARRARLEEAGRMAKQSADSVREALKP
jgi:uncharacterized membrane protein